MAISAVDIALWDLKARLLELPLATLLGAVHEQVPVYGSGGFTSYSIDRLQQQLAAWVQAGIPRVKMKIGSHPQDDLERVAAAREAIGEDAALFVDANGAYARKQALAQAERLYQRAAVSWFEEPVSSEDLDGLRLLRDRGPAGMEIAAGEYGYEPAYFQRMLAAGAVDVAQAHATRCGGITGLLAVAALCQAHQIPLSAHCAPQLHAHACCAIGPLRHLEYFHDHARIEQLLFDGRACPAGRRAAARSGSSWPRDRSQGPRRRGLRGMKRRSVSVRRSRLVRNLRRGRAQRLLSGATAAAALPLGAEIYVNHYGGWFGNKWMWTPVVLPPALGAAGVAGVLSAGAARTWLPACSALYVAIEALGVYLHLRGIARNPGGLREASYNLVMGPPLLAPGSLTMVGAIGLTAAVMRRER
jgi:enolase-like protein/mandelate racemase/muconate lactonizing enzyme-like protein